MLSISRLSHQKANVSAQQTCIVLLVTREACSHGVPMSWVTGILDATLFLVCILLWTYGRRMVLRHPYSSGFSGGACSSHLRALTLEYDRLAMCAGAAAAAHGAEGAAGPGSYPTAGSSCPAGQGSTTHLSRGCGAGSGRARISVAV